MRVGPITASTSKNDLRRLFGAAALVDEPPDSGRGAVDPTTVVYKGDPSRSVSILWHDVNGRQRPWTVSVCSLSDNKTRCLWHTQDGISMYTTLRQLEKLNGKPFVLMGIRWDYSGTVVSWEGGRLEGPQSPGRFILRLYPDSEISPEEDKQIDGQIPIPSFHQVMQKLNPEVYELGIEFP